MKRAPDPLHYWIVALGKTIEWLLAYVRMPGDATSGEVQVNTTQAEPRPQQEINDDG